MKMLKSALPALLLLCASLRAQTYIDTDGDTLGTPPFLLDILSVQVSNDDSYLHFTVNVGDNSGFAANSFVRLLVGFDTVSGGTSSANAWGNGTTMPGMDFFAGGTASDMNLYSSSLGGWPEGQNANNNTWASYSPVVIDSNGIQFSAPLATLGLTPGATFKFDVFTAWADTGHAFDALGNAANIQNSWTTVPYDSGVNVLSYTVTTAIPEPSTYVLLLGGIASALVFSQRRRQAKVTPNDTCAGLR